jgi:hypothetical protein
MSRDRRDVITWCWFACRFASPRGGFSMIGKVNNIFLNYT